MSERTEDLKKKVEEEKAKIAETEEVKKLEKELVRLQNKKAAKVADVLQDAPKIIGNCLMSFGRIAGKVVEGLNKMDEKVLEMQEEENKKKLKGRNK